MSFFTRRYVHMEVKTLLNKCCPLSDKIVSGMRKGITQCLKNLLATWVEEIFVVGIARVRLLYLSVLMTTNSLLDLVRESGPRMPMTTNYKGPLRGNSSNLCW